LINNFNWIGSTIVYLNKNGGLNISSWVQIDKFLTNWIKFHKLLEKYDKEGNFISNLIVYLQVLLYEEQKSKNYSKYKPITNYKQTLTKTIYLFSSLLILIFSTQSSPSLNLQEINQQKNELKVKPLESPSVDSIWFRIQMLWSQEHFLRPVHNLEGKINRTKPMNLILFKPIDQRQSILGNPTTSECNITRKAVGP
jgi:hypothetical protein